jgi:hypothetical protein
MPLTTAQMRSLLNEPSGTKTQFNALVRGENGLEKAKVSTSQFGKYEGKTGTKTRGRKGNVRVAPNGRRYYEAQWPTWEDSPIGQVVAYQA